MDDTAVSALDLSMPLSWDNAGEPPALNTFAPSIQAGVMATSPAPAHHTISISAPAEHGCLAPAILHGFCASPSSRTTTPEESANTVLRASPGRPTPTPPSASHSRETPISSPTAPASPLMGRATPPPTHRVDGLAAATSLAQPSEHDVSSMPLESLDQDGSTSVAATAIPVARDSFETFLDTFCDELSFHTEVGRNKIDVILYQGFEFRRDRLTEKQKTDQLWVCRHAGKFKCKAKVKLHVPHLDDFTRGSSVTQAVPHNHQPYILESYGRANISVIESAHTSTDQADASDSELRSNHAISQLSAADFSADFDEVNLDAVARSSPIAPRVLRPAQAAHGDQAIDITTILIDTSQEDARGFRLQRYVQVPRTRASDVQSIDPSLRGQAAEREAADPTS